MNESHSTDFEIQLYTFDINNCDKSIIQHIESCNSCKTKSQEYLMIYTEVKLSSGPSFDFSLPDLVMSRLPVATRKPSPDISAISLVVFVLIVFMSGVILLKGYLTGYIKDQSQLLWNTVIVSAFTVVLFKIYEIYKDFKKKMVRLDQY